MRRVASGWAVFCALGVECFLRGRPCDRGPGPGCRLLTQRRPLVRFFTSSAVERDSPNGRLWNIGAGSLRFDVRELDHLAPLLGFVGKELAVVGGRARNRSAALFGKPRLDLRIGKARVDLTIELVDDFGRRVLGGAKSQP